MRRTRSKAQALGQLQRRTAVGLVVGGLVLAGCASDDTQGAPTTDADTAPEATSDATMTEPAEAAEVAAEDDRADAADRQLDLILVTTALPALPYLAAISNDVFSEFDIEIGKWTNLGGGSSNVINAIVADLGKVGTAGCGPVIDAIEAGAPLKLIATNMSPLTMMVMRTEVAEGIEAATGTTADSPLEERMAALQGLTIGMHPTGAINHTMFQILATDHGFDPATDFNVQASDQGTITAGLISGRFEAAQWVPGVFEQAIADGEAVPWITYSADDYAELRDLLWLCAFTTTDFADNHVEVLSDVLDALRESNRRLVEEPDTVVPAAQEEFYAEMDASVFEAALGPIQDETILDLRISEEAFNFTIDVQEEFLDKEYSSVTFDEAVADLAKR